MESGNEKKYLEEVSREVQDTIYAGQKIEAIKLFREETGCGLKEAKEEVEQIERQLRELSPGAFTARTGGGCLGVVLLGVGIGLLIKTIIG